MPTWASLVAQLVKNPPAMQETFFNSWVGKSPRRNGRLSPPAFLGFPGGSDGKRIRLQCGRPGLDPWVGKIPWRRAWQLTPVFLPEESPWTEEPGSYSPWACKESDTTERLHFHFSLSCTGGGNGNPLQHSCLENRRDGGAWWAAVYGVAQSWTQLKQLSSSSSRAD